MSRGGDLLARREIGVTRHAVQRPATTPAAPPRELSTARPSPTISAAPVGRWYAKMTR
jgi:hypothetical protein